jgi:hypothetical protein
MGVADVLIVCASSRELTTTAFSAGRIAVVLDIRATKVAVAIPARRLVSPGAF